MKIFSKLGKLYEMIGNVKGHKPLSSSVSSLLIRRLDSKSTSSARWSAEPFRMVRTWAADGTGDIVVFPTGPYKH